MTIDKSLFYQSDLSEDLQNISLEEDTRKHVVTVLRMNEGDDFLLTNGKGLSARATIQQIDKRSVTVELSHFQHHPSNEVRISLGISLLKNNTRFEWMLEKVTELGVYEIFPMVFDRTERQHFRKERFEQIIRSASLQSEQCIFPLLHHPQSMEELFNRNHLPSSRFIAHCYANEKSDAVKASQSSLLLIGPEGDFTEGELAFAYNNDCKPIGLGSTRLRTETAGVVGVALLRG